MWNPIETAPWKKEVLLTGGSGYCKPHDRFIINGYRLKDWHQGEWNDATGTHLSERGWEPTHWMELPDAPDNAQQQVQPDNGYCNPETREPFRYTPLQVN